MVVLAVASLGVLPALAEGAARTVPQGFFGVMYDSVALKGSNAVQQRQYALMARSGVETVRVGFVWEFLQPSRGEDFDFTYTDRYVRLAAAHGLDVLPVMLYAPPWAREFRRRLYSPPRTKAFVAFLRASVRRYGPNGSFWRENPDVPRRPIRDWQVWNEPNIRAFWDVSREDRRLGWPHGYSSLLRASDRALERSDPSARTVTGGLIGASWTHLSRLYATGARGGFDVVGIHIYPQNERRVVAAVRRVRRVLDAHGDHGKRIFLTETAFPASLGHVRPIANQHQETPRGMAARLTTVFARLVFQRRQLGLDKVFWYSWATTYAHPKSNFEYAGLLAGPKYRPQPGLVAYRRVARRYEGCAKGSTGACR